MTGGSWWVIRGAVLRGGIAIATAGLRCLLSLSVMGECVCESSSESERNVENVCHREVRFVLGVIRRAQLQSSSESELSLLSVLFSRCLFVRLVANWMRRAIRAEILGRAGAEGKCAVMRCSGIG